MRPSLVTLAGAALLLAACDDGASRAARPAPEPARTVEELLAEPEALRAALARCADDPGARGAGPECRNAEAARRRRTADEMTNSLR